MLIPLGDRILIEPIYPKPVTSESGLIEVVGGADPPVTMGKVAHLKAAYPCSNPKCQVTHAPQVAEGQTVIFAPSSGEEVQINGTDYIMLREQDILAIVEE